MPATELVLLNGERHRVDGEPAQVEKSILAAARGSLLEFAWLREADSGREIGVNPAHVAALRAADA